MAHYDIVGNSSTTFLTNPTLLFGQLLYATAIEFGILNRDGTRSFYHGTGFVWDATQRSFTAGTLASISHFDANGGLI